MFVLVKLCFKPLSLIGFITVNTIVTKLLICTARLAQTVERGTFNPEVEGSSPSSGVVKNGFEVCIEIYIRGNCNSVQVN
jgi:hypothetical protein